MTAVVAVVDVSPLRKLLDPLLVEMQQRLDDVVLVRAVQERALMPLLVSNFHPKSLNEVSALMLHIENDYRRLLSLLSTVQEAAGTDKAAC